MKHTIFDTIQKINEELSKQKKSIKEASYNENIIGMMLLRDALKMYIDNEITNAGAKLDDMLILFTNFGSAYKLDKKKFESFLEILDFDNLFKSTFSGMTRNQFDNLIHAYTSDENDFDIDITYEEIQEKLGLIDKHDSNFYGNWVFEILGIVMLDNNFRTDEIKDYLSRFVNMVIDGFDLKRGILEFANLCNSFGYYIYK